MIRIENASETMARAVGIVAGAALAAALVVAFRVPPGTGAPGADVVVAAAPTGELAVSPAGNVLAKAGLRPGEVVRGTLEVTNQTGSRVAVRVRGAGEARDLDRLLLVRIEAGGINIFAGHLDALRRGTRPFPLASGARETLTVSVSLPRGSGVRSAARIASVALMFSTEAGR